MGQDALNKRIEKLADEASNNLDNFDRANEALWRSLVRLLLLWIDCQKFPGFLDALYAARKIKYRTPSDNGPTFFPLIKVVFAKSKIKAKDQSRFGLWNGALRALYVEYEDNPVRYRVKGEAKLLAYLKDNGGIDGLIRKDGEDRNEREDDIDIEDQQIGINPFREAPYREILKQSAKNVANSAPVGSVQTTAPLRIGDENLIAILARLDASGSISVIGSTNRRSAIELVAQGVIKLSQSSLDPQLRLLAEVIKTQAYPPEAMPQDLEARRKWMQDVYRDETKFSASIPGDKAKRKPKKLKSTKKLLIRGANKQLVLSASRLKASVVTRCQTSSLPAALTEQICLRGKDLVLIERMLETTEINAVSPIVDPVDRPTALFGVPVGSRQYYSIQLKRPQNKVQIISFYDPARDAGLDYSFQSSFDFASWSPQWSFAVQQDWFARLRERLLDRWFATLGAKRQVKRLHNQALRISVEPTTVKIEFNITELGGPPPIEMNIANTKLPPQRQSISALYLSKDLAPVLYNLADIEIEGDIQLSGTELAMVVCFKTPSGAFDIAIPTAELARGDKAYQRIETAFQELRYG